MRYPNGAAQAVKAAEYLGSQPYSSILGIIIEPMAAVEPITTVVLDTVAGLVTGYAKVQGDAVESVSIRNVPSFLYQSTTIKIPNLGSIAVDVAYGGDYKPPVEYSSAF